MELIVDVVREGTLGGPWGADSRPDLVILHTAQALSCCNYLSHWGWLCVCVFRSEGCGRRQHLHLTHHANQPCVSHKWHEKSTNGRVHLPETLTPPGAAPFLAPSNYLWACGRVGTIVCCPRSTQGDVGLMRTPWPLWLGLTAASFAWGDGAFISSCSRISGTDTPDTWTHNTHTARVNYLTSQKTQGSLVCSFLLCAFVFKVSSRLS